MIDSLAPPTLEALPVVWKSLEDEVPCPGHKDAPIQGQGGIAGVLMWPAEGHSPPAIAGERPAGHSNKQEGKREACLNPEGVYGSCNDPQICAVNILTVRHLVEGTPGVKKCFLD